ncbi:malonyl-CoA decarboxylase, partial [Ramicandelaber brevisporus]
SLDTAFKHVLQQQLHSGNLELRRITWASPAFTLEKLSEYEAVHAMTDWNDIKRRVGPGRRCYGFFGKSMPLEPLVFVQIALTSNLATSVQSILDDHAPWIIKSAAIFYSITSQRGLAGVELGSTLIKRVMGELQSEFPSDLQLFSTLSPIPGLPPAAVATATTNVRPALDPVANFHLRNGACIRRINWLGDTSTKGLNESFGMMVNYQY